MCGIHSLAYVKQRAWWLAHRKMVAVVINDIQYSGGHDAVKDKASHRMERAP